MLRNNLFIHVILALILTFGVIFYQRTTGPTYEKNITHSINGTEYNFEFIRSHEITEPCLIELLIPDSEVTANIKYKRFPTKDSLTVKAFERSGDTLRVELPNQPMAGKLQYSVSTQSPTGENLIAKDVVVRFKGFVPRGILAIHIFLMFASYFFAIFAGLLAIFNHDKYKLYTLISLSLLFFGGLVLGPIVQKYAFDVWWSGFPFGMDLTDNKLLIAFVVWLIAWMLNRNKNRRWFVVAAMIVHMIVYSIPHSAMGSEYDYESGAVGTSEKFKD